MAFSHGKNAQIWIADSGATLRNFTSVGTQVSFDRSADTSDVTAFGDAAKKYLAGVKDGTMSLEGNRDATYEGYLDGILGTETTFRYFPEGSATGKIQYDGTAIVTTFNETSDSGDANKWSAELQLSGAAARTTVS
jgi:hypothetical protein